MYLIAELLMYITYNPQYKKYTKKIVAEITVYPAELSKILSGIWIIFTGARILVNV